MTITPLQLYLIMKLDSLNAFGGSLVWIGGLVLILCLVVSAFGFIVWEEIKKDSSFGDVSRFPKALKLVGSISLCFILFGILLRAIPTTKEMAAILIIPKVVNNDRVQQLPSKVVDLADEWLEELKPKGKGREAK